jgi:hypothetical protein
MPNAVKYSTTKVNNSIKTKNVVFGINDVDYSPTSTTGYWNGITPPISGYTIYNLPSGSTTPSIVCPVTDNDVIYWAKVLGGGSGITTKVLALQYITTGLTNSVVVNKNYPNIVTSGMAINLESSFVPSYPVSGTTTYDISGNGATGTLSTVTFINGNAFSLNGSSSNIICSSSTAIDNLSASTFSILYNWTEAVGITSTSLLYKSDNNNTAGWWVNMDSTYGGIGLTVVVTSNKRYYLPASQTPARNKWVDLTVTWTGNTTTTGGVDIYINGVKNNTAPQTNNAGSGSHTTDVAEPLNIGNNRSGSANYFGGYISNVQIYNRVLSATEIAQNYYQAPIITSGLTLMADASNLVSYFTGSTWNDLTANQYVGTLNNTPTFYFNAFTFNGTNQFTSYNYTGGTTDSYTFTGWFKTDSTAGKSFVGRGRDDGSGFSTGWSISLGTNASNNISFAVTTSTPTVATTVCEGSSVMSINTWYFLAGTWNPSVGLKSYVNGVLEATTGTTNTNLRTSTSGINVATLGNTSFYSCTVGNFAIYNRVLSDSEIGINYAATRGIYT